MKRVLLKAPPYLGDEVVLTGVVRELKKETGWSLRVATQRPELWAHHPFIDGVGASGEENVAMTNDLCPGFRTMAETPLHFSQEYLDRVRDALGLNGRHRITKFGGEIPLCDDEIKAGPPFGINVRYWVVFSGFKHILPTKGWLLSGYQEVVDSFRGRILFVQAGDLREWHPPLLSVLDVVGKTPLRDLIRLIYFAEGVLCPITSGMHLAAAVPTPLNFPFKRRPCVVIAGGREPVHVIQYPMHRVINTIGLLTCCASSGCGKNEFSKDQCPFPVAQPDGRPVPKCMTLIKPRDVATAVEWYYRGEIRLPPTLGRVRPLFDNLGITFPHTGAIRGAEGDVPNVQNRRKIPALVQTIRSFLRS